MRKSSQFVLFYFVLAAFLLASLTGCQQKQEEPAKPAQQTEQPAVTQPAVDTAAPKAEVKPEPVVEIPDLKGTWSGTMMGRSSTLKITSQSGAEFSGSITVNLREAIHQSVSGKVNPETGTISMRDTERNRNAGSYSGKLSADKTKFSGTFTQTVDRTTASFSFSKQ
jgi:glucose/arabinose dehydrogenase